MPAKFGITSLSLSPGRRPDMATLDWEEADREIRDMFPKALCPNCDRIMTLPKLLEVLTTNNAVIACTGPKGCYAKIPASHLKPPPD